MNNIIEINRLKTVRAKMKKAGVDCLIVTANENVCYLSGFTGHDSWLVVSNRYATLITDSRYTEQAQNECVGCKIIERDGNITKAAAELIGNKKSIRTIGVENTISIATLQSIKKEFSAKVKPVSGIVEAVRRKKDDNETKSIEKAAKISYECLFEAISSFKTGITESEVAGIIEYQMRKRQATAFFDTIVCFGANCSQNHHQPGSAKLKRNDTVLIDFGAKFGSYGCDITRSFCVGKPNPLYEKVWFTVKDAQQAAIEAIRPGVKIIDVDAICREVIAKTNLPMYGHGTGHGLGLEVHELPRVSSQSKNVLEPGDVITIEPGIYMPGKLGVRIEDDILVTETGYRILTKDKKFGFSGNDMPVL
jgi:Xaa-Pro aminopeptidase